MSTETTSKPFYTAADVAWDHADTALGEPGAFPFTRGVYPRQDRFLYWFNEEWRRAMGRPTLG